MLITLGLAACAGTDPAVHPALRGLWHDYRELPAERALAVAGEPDRHRFVAGVVGGASSRVEAEAAALGECRRRRAQARMQDPCRLYAVGDEVVWTGPGP